MRNGECCRSAPRDDSAPELISQSRRLWFEQIDHYRREIADEIEEEIRSEVGKEGLLLMKAVVSKLGWQIVSG